MMINVSDNMIFCEIMKKYVFTYSLLIMKLTRIALIIYNEFTLRDLLSYITRLSYSFDNLNRIDFIS